MVSRFFYFLYGTISIRGSQQIMTVCHSFHMMNRLCILNFFLQKRNGLFCISRGEQGLPQFTIVNGSPFSFCEFTIRKVKCLFISFFCFGCVSFSKTYSGKTILKAHFQIKCFSSFSRSSKA